MNTRLVIGLLLSVLILGLFYILSRQSIFNQVLTNSPTPQTTTNPTGTAKPQPQKSDNQTASATPSSSSVPLVSNVKLYFVAIDDGGKSGIKFGCNDSLIAANTSINPTSTPLKASMEKLLSIKDQYYGQSGLYNSLYRSNLTLESAIISDSTATIKLTGQISSGGTCDDPRIINQIKQTALQFTTVKNVNILVNNTPIENLLSGK